MLKTETVIDLKIRNSYTGKLGKSYNNCHSLCNSFLEFLVIFILFCYKYIYIYMYIFLFTANAAKEAMLPYFPQIVEFIKVITALPVDSDVK